MRGRWQLVTALGLSQQSWPARRGAPKGRARGPGPSPWDLPLDFQGFFVKLRHLCAKEFCYVEEPSKPAAWYIVGLHWLKFHTLLATV